MLASNGIIHAIHVSRFADKLISRIPELEKRTIKNRRTVVLTDRVDEYVFNQILEPDSFLHSTKSY